MAPPRLKRAKKKGGMAQLVDKDDYLEAADDHEQSMGKHRVGDPAKALRFAERALEIYSQGLEKFPRSFDLAYNKARLQLEVATDGRLSGALQVPVLSVLREALRSHHYAQDIDPTHADTLFNMAQVLTGMAEIIAEDDQIDDSEALQSIKKALEIQTRCFELQRATFAKNRSELERAMRETAENSTAGADNEQSTSNSTTDPRSAGREEEWAFVEEPVTAITLLETIIAQIEALSALCSILSSSVTSSPESGHAAATDLSWIDSYSGNLLTKVLPTLIDENRPAIEPRLSDVMIPRAVFISNYLGLSFRLSVIDAERYKNELEAAFAQPGLDVNSKDFMWASARALIFFNNALACSAPTDAVAASHGAFRWQTLISAQAQLSSLAKIPDIPTHELATTHSLRGDVNLSLQTLAYPPVAHLRAQTTTPQLLSNAEVYYRNAAKIFGTLGGSMDEERTVCEFKSAIARILREVTTGQAATDNNPGQNNSGTTPSWDQIERALGPALWAKGEQWVRDQVEEIVNEGLVIPQIFSAVL